MNYQELLRQSAALQRSAVADRSGDLLPTVILPGDVRDKIALIGVFMDSLNKDYQADETRRGGLMGPPMPGTPPHAGASPALLSLWSAWRNLYARWLEFKTKNGNADWTIAQTLATKSILETAEQYERDATDYQKRLLDSGGTSAAVVPRPEPPTEFPGVAMFGGGAAVGIAAILAAVLVFRR